MFSATSRALSEPLNLSGAIRIFTMAIEQVVGQAHGLPNQKDWQPERLPYNL
jgi:hypothetical protein